jgi:hypothetical protein
MKRGEKPAGVHMKWGGVVSGVGWWVQCARLALACSGLSWVLAALHSGCIADEIESFGESRVPAGSCLVGACRRADRRRAGGRGAPGPACAAGATPAPIGVPGLPGAKGSSAACLGLEGGRVLMGGKPPCGELRGFRVWPACRQQRRRQRSGGW